MYKESGWLSLKNRRTYQKLVYTFNIINGLAPDYLSSIYPNAVSNRLHYPLRNALDRDIMARRTELFASSFIPSSLRYGTIYHPILNHFTHHMSSILEFCKRSMFLMYQRYYLVGDGNMSVLHTRIRNQCSDLNFHVYLNHIKDNASCSCGYPPLFRSLSSLY